MPRDTEKKLYWRLLWLFLLLAVLVVVVLGSIRPAQTAVPSTPTEIKLRVIPLSTQNLTVKNKYVGYVTPIKSVLLQPQISGYLDKIWVQGGQEVKAGDNLVLIKQDEYQARLQAAIASVAQAQADYRNAEVYYRRLQKAGSKAVSPTELDNAKAAYLSAQAALKQAQSNQALAQVNLDYTLLQAPISGIVGNVDLTPGNYVSPSSGSLLSIIQYDPIRVVFSLSDKEYLHELSIDPQNMFAGKVIRLQLAGGLEYKPQGEFKFTANRLDRATNSIAVYADFPNPQHFLVANAYVDVVIEKELKDAYLIRQNYVTMTTDGSYVYTVKNNKLLKTPLLIAGESGSDYIVANRFAADEYLVIDKVGKLPPQARIIPQPVKAEPQTAKREAR